VKEVTMYADGACLGNPGPGGYGVVLLYGGRRRELQGGYSLTTNNRMELRAVIAGLEALKEPCSVTVFTDSRYVTDAVTKGWLRRWRSRNWMRNRRERALNADLWERLWGLCERHRVSFVWVKGHGGDKENERCDALSRQAAMGRDLPADPGYLSGVRDGGAP